MIAWNEAKTIDLALKSLKGFVDEVIIADTGSFDGTQKIAREWFDRLDLSGQVLDVKAKTLGQARLAALEQCDGDWILLLDANQVLPNALKKEMAQYQKWPRSICQVKSLNLMGDYSHYFSNRTFHAYHGMLYYKKNMRWKNDLDRPLHPSRAAIPGRITRQIGIRNPNFPFTAGIHMENWAVNLSRVRPAWRSWYRGEPFDSRYYKVGDLEYSFETSFMDQWAAKNKYDSIVEYVEKEMGFTLEDIKRNAPKWYLNQLRLDAVPVVGSIRRLYPEVIKEELKNPRYKLKFDGTGRIVGRWPEL